MWNGNGNGYGQGNGYGPQDTYDRLNNTREIGGARFPFLEGTGRYALCTLEEFMHTTDGPSARALFEVLECTDGKHAPGSYVVKIWKLVKPPKFQNGTTDADHFADFCRKLKNAPVGYPIGADIRKLMKERPAEQLARGSVIDAVASPKFAKDPATKAVIEPRRVVWVDIYWNAVQQSPPDIAAMRQRLEQKGIPDTGAKPQQAPMQQGYGQPMQPQYTAPVQPQYAPPAQQGYGQPMQPQYNGTVPGAPVQPAPAAPPQGGFLAQIPPNGPQGPQGGNNGNGGTW